jgi:hypothetical protein
MAPGNPADSGNAVLGLTNKYPVERIFDCIRGRRCPADEQKWACFIVIGSSSFQISGTSSAYIWMEFVRMKRPVRESFSIDRLAHRIG